MSKQHLLFGDIVVVEGDQVGVVVKAWHDGSKSKADFTYDVYMASMNCIITYPDFEVDRYRVRHKHLDEEELRYQNG